MKNKIKIAYAEDHVAFRKALLNTLKTFEEFEICAEAGNGRELIDDLMTSGDVPDVCILDINMPRLNGFETLMELKEIWPRMGVLVLTVFDFNQYVDRMVRNGANGFILKHADIYEIRTAITSICKHGYYRSGLIEESYQRRSTSGKLHILSQLTEKEIQLIKLCCSDLNYAQIAEKMGATQKSVEGHRDSLFKKLEIRSRVNLALFAVQYGIVTLEVNDNGDNKFLIKH